MRKLTLLLISFVIATPVMAEWSRAGLFGADVRSLVIDPADPDTMFLGTSHGEIFTTSNGGVEWSNPRGSVPFPGYVVDDLVIDRRGWLWMSGWGVWGGGVVAYSEDGGVTWTRRDRGIEDESVRALAVSASDPDVLVAGGLTGVWRSDGSGASWTKISSRENVESLAIDPRTSDTIFVGTWRQAWRSDDGGKSWTHIAEGMVLDTDVFGIDIDPRNPDDIWLSTCGWVYHSIDRGDQWTRYREGFENRRVHATARDPENRDWVYAGSVAGLYRTTDGGRSWTRISDDGLVINAIAIHADRPDRIVLGTEGDGVYISNDRGATFQRRSRGLHNVRIGSIVTAPDAEARVYAVARLAGSSSGIYVSHDQGRSWDRLNHTPLPEILSFVVSAGEDPRFVAGTENGFFHSRDGKEWIRSEPSTIALRVEKVLRNAGGQLFAATSEGVFVSRDGGVSWFRIGQPDQRVTDLEIARSGGTSSLYALTRDGLLRLTRDGWTEIDGSPGGLRLLRIGRGEDHTLVISSSRSTFAGKIDELGRWRGQDLRVPHGATIHLVDGVNQVVFFTSDESRHLSWARNGEPFTQTGLALRAAEVTGIAAHPEAPDRLFVGTTSSGLLVFDPERQHEPDQRFASNEGAVSTGTK